MEKHMPKNNFFCLFYISNFLLQYKIQKTFVQLMVTNKI